MAKNLRSAEADLPQQIRVSIGSAIVLGLSEGKLDAALTTAYLMTYRVGKCNANCSFCPQARDSKSNTELLSRVTWPAFATESVLKLIGNATEQGKIKRVCIQALNYPKVFTHLAALVTAIKHHANIPVSVSCQPLNKENMQCLAKAGVNRIGIALDAATEKLFNQVKGAKAKGPYIWNEQFKQLREAVNLFGKGNVSTHIIIGLGETEKEAVNLIQKSVDIGVLPALFAFTPIRGTTLENKPQPTLTSYRHIQLARHLITNGNVTLVDMRFNANGKITNFGINKTQLTQIVETGKPFLTSGCPDCNRPFYNEKPSGPIYNYPQKPSHKEILAIKQQLS